MTSALEGISQRRIGECENIDVISPLAVSSFIMAVGSMRVAIEKDIWACDPAARFVPEISTKCLSGRFEK